MIVALLGYFSTMIAALVGLMFLLNSVLSSSFIEHAHRQPYPMPAMADAAIPDEKPAASVALTGVETRNPAVAEKKSAGMKVARNQRRKEDLVRKEALAGRQQDREYSLALGYAEGDQRQAGGFTLFGPRRF
jgi:hypothetical protein